MAIGDLFAWTTPMPKPVKGEAQAKRVQKQIAREDHEDRQKTKVRKRDGYRCRWPNCDCQERRDRIEVAHVIDKGKGGSSDADNMIVLCLARHQGKPSLHSGDLKVEPLTRAGTNGPCAFYRKTGKRWTMVAQERDIHILERD